MLWIGVGLVVASVLLLAIRRIIDNRIVAKTRPAIDKRWEVEKPHISSTYVKGEIARHYLKWQDIQAEERKKIGFENTLYERLLPLYIVAFIAGVIMIIFFR